MRQTTKFLTEHVIEPLALIIESYIIHVSWNIQDLATAGHCELLDQMMDKYGFSDDALVGAIYGDSIELIHRIINRGVSDYIFTLLGACKRATPDMAEFIIDRCDHNLAPIDVMWVASIGVSRSSSLEMLMWLCDKFDVDEHVFNTIATGAAESGNAPMLLIALYCGGRLRSFPGYDAGKSGSWKVLEIIARDQTDYEFAFRGACAGNHLEMVKKLIKRGQMPFDIGFRSAYYNLNILTYLATNAPISTTAYTNVYGINMHTLANKSDYERDLNNITGIANPNDENSLAVVRWILRSHRDRINFQAQCETCVKRVDHGRPELISL